jgi:hypothetical protein
MLPECRDRSVFLIPPSAGCPYALMSLRRRRNGLVNLVIMYLQQNATAQMFFLKGAYSYSHEPIVNVITSHGVECHQYADNMQLFLTVHTGTI